MNDNQTKLNMFLAVIVTLFLIGLVVFIFIVSNNKILGAMTSEGTMSGSIDEQLTFINGTGSATSVAGNSGVSLSNVNVEWCGYE
jgi:uncharacterized membrane protein SpoIIM required for sporulation